MGPVLVVDDNADIRRAVARMLDRVGVVAVTVGTGREALDAVRDHAVSLILLDISMPDMDGLQILAAIRATPASQATPVIMHSAVNQPEIVSDAMRLGATDFIVKPDLTLARLRSVISRCVP